jgi:hypothetical protein
MTILGIGIAWYDCLNIIYIPFLDDDKKSKSLPLAPIVVEILVSRGSAYKIATESGTILPENAKSFCSKN